MVKMVVMTLWIRRDGEKVKDQDVFKCFLLFNYYVLIINIIIYLL